MKNTVTVILNSFKRQNFLNLQVESIRSQFAKVDKILIWNNGKNIPPNQFEKDITVINSSSNFGVWARFAFALNSETEYVCIFDDDTIPGKLFLSNCLDTMQKTPALLGARGLRFLSSYSYEPYISFGWDNPNEEPEIVDIVGHAWFFKREWLTYFWREMPKIKSSRLVGEDMHFSFMLKKYANIKTIVPPHPISDKRLWGSHPDYAIRIGTDKQSISQDIKSLEKFDKALRFYTKQGILLCKDDKKVDFKKYYVLPKILNNTFLKKFIKSFPILKKIAIKLKNYLFKKNISF